MFEIGDKVKYVPAKCHRYDRLPNGDFLWEFTGYDRKGKTVTLSSKEVSDKINYMRTPKGLVDPATKKGTLLTAIRPKHFLDAVITNVNGDGTFDLEIEGALRGVSYQYRNIKFDTNKAEHTCHYQ